MALRACAFATLDNSRKFKKKTNLVETPVVTIQQLEQDQPEIESIDQAKAILSQKGVVLGEHLTKGDMMLEAAQLGLINVLKTFECL